MLRGLYVAGALLAISLPAQAGNWTGFYFGGLASYNAVTLEDTLGTEGPGITGLVGYDVQIDRFLIGAWGEYGHKTFDWKGGSLTGLFPDVDVDVQAWAAGGRVGFIVTDKALLFASLGYTEGEADLSLVGGGGDLSVDLSGYVAGGGAEIDLSHGFFARADYQYARYDVEDEDLEANVHSARLGLVYKFNWGRDEFVIPAIDVPASAAPTKHKPLK
jgi:outer membrane immunogenic protein